MLTPVAPAPLPVQPAPLEEPPVREDGLCVVCLHDRKPERSRRYAGDIAEFDPFCSMPCARNYYGCPLPPTSPNGRPKRVAA